MTSKPEVNCCNQAWLLKNSVIGADLVWAGVGAAVFFFSFLGGEDQRWDWRAEEAHQSLDVLRSRCQEDCSRTNFIRRKRRNPI